MDSIENQVETQKAASRFEKDLFLAIRIGAWIGAFSVLISMMLIVLDVIGRRFFGFSILFAAELSQNLLVWLSFLGFAFAHRQGAHVDVRLVVDHLSPKAKRMSEFVASLAGLFFCGFVTWVVTQLTINSYKSGFEVWGVLHTPLFLVQMVMPIGFFMFTLLFLLETFKACRRFADH
jgi:TRAP-type C4-dicarboxylate transport system permease small subunit